MDRRGKSPPPWGDFFSGGDFSGGDRKRIGILQTKKVLSLCKIFACDTLLDSVFSKFSPAAGFNDLFSLYSLTLKVY